MSWTAITQEAYGAARSADSSLLTELIPDLGKARSPSTIAHKKFWLIFQPLSERFPKPWYFHDVGCSQGKYTERLYVQHDSGAVFCLGTYFLAAWRIWGDKKDQALIADFCAFAGIPAIAYDPEHIKKTFARECAAHGLQP